MEGLTRAQRRELKRLICNCTPAYLVMDELPETIDSGELILYNGTIWRGVEQGESSLSTGTPWPIKGYKEYTALLTQSGTDDPVATVLANDLGGTVVWTRDNTGIYIGTLAGAFGTNNVIFHATFGKSIGDAYTIPYAVAPSNDFVIFYSMDETGAPSDMDTEYGTNISIKVYQP